MLKNGALFLVALVIGAIRFQRLGDLSLTYKFLNSGFWTLVVFAGGAGFAKVFSLVFTSGTFTPSATLAAARQMTQQTKSFRPEDLATLETEIPELEHPEVSGLHGKPPEELAEALRKLSDLEKP